MRDELRIAAAEVLRANDRGTMTVAAPRLYPHQWSWDAAFIAIGWAHLSAERAVTELETLLAAQWTTGMIPHVVFAEDAPAYFPGPSVWRCAEVADAAPARPATSGICQPPVHAIAISRIAEIGRGRASVFARESWQVLYAWHRWLVTARRDPASRLITIVHGWESGMDNSPRWDGPYSRVRPTASSYARTDLGVVGDASQRPSQDEYDRYLFLIEEMRSLRYDDAAMARSGSFRVGDVFLTAILALACDVLLELAETYGINAVPELEGADPASGLPDDPEEMARAWYGQVTGNLRRWAAELREAVANSVSGGLARDFDVRTGQYLESGTVAGFAPLLCGGPLDPELLAAFDRWCGDPRLTAYAPPSTAPGAEGFEPRRYWRGPMWPFATWLFGWALDRHGNHDTAARLREGGLSLVSERSFGEYYEPFTGEPLGSSGQSWTAAVTLDWLSRDSSG